MQKKAFLALLLVLSLVLSGCTLIQKDEAVDAATEIIRLGDQVVTKGEIQNEVNYQLSYTAYYYSMFGYSYDPTSAESIASAREAVIENYKKELVSHAKIEELALDQLTDEDNEKIQLDAEKAYQENLDYIISSNYANSELSEEEIRTKAVADLEKSNYTMDTAAESAKHTLLEQKLRDYIIKDVTVTEDEVKAEYDDKVESAKTDYEEDLSSYCSDVNGGTKAYYTPAGIRMVKQILIQYGEEEKTAISDAKAKVTAAQAIIDNEESTDEEKTQAQADLEAAQAEVEAATEAAYASIDEAADAVIAEIEAGADWDTLMAEKTMDPGMQEGRDTAVTGYAICENMSGFDAAFVEAGMALKNIGDVSAKTRGSSDGYYIIKYVGDAVEGAIDYDSVKEEIEADLLSDKQDSTYDDTIDDWVSKAEFKIDTKPLDN